MSLRRRDLLASVAAFAAASGGAAQANLIQNRFPWAPYAALPPVIVQPGPWRFFTPEEGALVDAIADRLIPPDEHASGGKDAGCAVFLDRQLAGPYGRSEALYRAPPFLPPLPTQGEQNPRTIAERYRAGLAAIDAHCRGAFAGRVFRDLAPDQQDRLLASFEAGQTALAGEDSASFFRLMLRNVMEGFFADPVHGGNRDMTSWKMIGFPGARYDHRDWVHRHNQRYDLPPVGIAGRVAEETSRGP